ncbi:hypothetical protein FOZ60_015818 [Perkinsus olseni]|uniref:Secreted protein n=1 Tax=Perkinsus olseni TaxID=32597 RepID=A0A7J6P7G2_PEROL|nr:hypothetical protein FOZ60_015818 [Perkinsus olseni]
MYKGSFFPENLEISLLLLSPFMPVVAKESFGSPVPYAEPSWYTKGYSSPYYTQSHIDWRTRCREVRRGRRSCPT